MQRSDSALATQCCTVRVAIRLYLPHLRCGAYAWLEVLAGGGVNQAWATQAQVRMRVKPGLPVINVTSSKGVGEGESANPPSTPAFPPALAQGRGLCEALQANLAHRELPHAASSAPDQSRCGDCDPPKPSAALSQTLARVAGRHAVVRRHAHPQPPARPHVAGVPASGGAARAGTLGALRELPGLRAAALLLPQQ